VPRPVTDRPELALAVPDHIDGGQEQPVTTRVRRPDARPQEGRVAEDQLGGNVPLWHQAAVAVDVGEDEIEERDPLGHGRFEGRPLGIVHHQGQGSSDHAWRRLWWSSGHVVGGALVAQEPGHLGATGNEAAGSQSGQLRRHLFPAGTYRAVRTEVLVDPPGHGRILWRPGSPALRGLSPPSRAWRWSLRSRRDGLGLPPGEGRAEVGLFDPARGWRPGPPAPRRGTR
jgi:hypothetical protein